MTTELIIGIIVLGLLFLVIVLSNIRIVPQSKAYVMERLGVYSRTWHTGLHIKLPFIERRRGMPIDLREQILVCGENFNHGQYHRHEKHNEDFYGVEDGYSAHAMASNEQSNERTHSGVIHEIDKNRTSGDIRENSKGGYGYYHQRNAGYHNRGNHSPKSQPVITKDNVSMEIDTVVFYQITDPKLYVYGHAHPLKAIEHLVATTLRNIVGELELDETLTSREFINTKMRTVLDQATDAWGIKITRVEIRNIIISDIELAEAMEKQMIAERTRRAQVIAAEGQRSSDILVAEGKKQAAILVAEGKAEAIRLVNDATPSQEFLTIRALEAYEVAADGKATKIIVPSSLQSLAGLALSGSEIFKEGEKME